MQAARSAEAEWTPEVFFPGCKPVGSTMEGFEQLDSLQSDIAP
jgi:hypothetical protein